MKSEHCNSKYKCCRSGLLPSLVVRCHGFNQSFLQLNNLIVCIIFLIPFTLSAQPFRIDSLKTVLTQARDDSSKIEIMVELSASFRSNQPDSAIEYSKKALLLAEKSTCMTCKARALSSAGIINEIVGNYEKALDFHLQSLKISESIGNKKLMASNYNNLGIVYKKQGNLQLALEYHHRSLELRQEMNDRYSMASSYNNIGSILNLLGNQQKALEFLTRALLIKTELRDSAGMAHAFNNIAFVYMNLDYNNEALDYFKKANSIYEKIDEQYGVASTLLNIGTLLVKTGKKFEGMKYIDSGMAFAKILNYKDAIKTATYELSRNFAAVGDYKNAYQYLVESDNYKDSLVNTENLRRSQILQKEYELDKKQIEIDNLEMSSRLQEKESEKLKVYAYSFGSGFLIILIFSFILYRSYQQKKRINSLLVDKQSEITNKNLELEQQREEILAKNEKLDNLNATKDKFFSIIAHDLKNPLGSIRDITSVLAESFDEISDEEKREILHLMKDSSRNVYSLLDNLLEWSRSQSGHIKYHPIDCNLLMLVENSVSPLLMNATKKNIDFKVNIPQTIEVHCDPNMIKTVIRNLSSNAIKFTPDDGKVTIDVKPIDSTDLIEVRVKDSGVGDFSRQHCKTIPY